jgi:hypothetical protein
VVDDDGRPVEGAALEIGGAAVFTDSHGRFFHRLSGTRAVALRILLDDFLVPGPFAVVSAPTMVTPRLERESTPIRVVVRRAQPNRPEPAPASPDRQPPND